MNFVRDDLYYYELYLSIFELNLRISIEEKNRKIVATIKIF